MKWKWPALNVSGFIAQLVEHRTGIARSRVQTPLKSWIFSGFFTQLHKLRSLRQSFLHLHFIYAVPIWFISDITLTLILSREHMNPQLTCSQRQWFHSSVGRALHRYREVTCSNSVEVLNFFQASLRNRINCVHCDDHFFIFISFPQFLYDLFHISLAQEYFCFCNVVNIMRTVIGRCPWSIRI